MKTILAICAVTLVVGAALIWNATRMPSRYGEFIGVAKADVADLVNQPEKFLHKTVAIEGTVKEQCTTMGCFFFFEAGKKTLRVDLQEIAMNAPRKNGHSARVEGQIVPYADGYQFFASAVEFD